MVGCDKYTTLYVAWSMAPGSWGGSRPQVFSTTYTSLRHYVAPNIFDLIINIG